MIETDRDALKYKRLFVDNLIMVRHNRGLTQIETAKALGVSKGTIGAIEARKNLPRFNLFLKMCKLYEVEPCRFLEGRIIARVD